MASAKSPLTKTQRNKVVDAARELATVVGQFADSVESNDAMSIVHSTLDVLIAYQRFEGTLGNVIQEVEQ